MKLFYLILFSSLLVLGNAQDRVEKSELDFQDNYLEAMIHIYLGEYEEGINLLRPIHQLDRRNPVISMELSRAYEASGDNENAVKFAKLATQNDPNNIWYHVAQGRLLIMTEDMEGCASTFKKLSILDPKDFSHIENHAKCLIASGQKEEAIKVVEKWELVNGIHEPLVKIKYDLYKERNNFMAAERELKKLIQAYPSELRFLNNLALFYFQNQKIEQAENTYRAVLEIAPNNPQANAGILKLSKGKQGTEANYLLSLKPIIEKVDVDERTKIKELIPYLLEAKEKGDSTTIKALSELTHTLTLIHPDKASTHAINGDVLSLLKKYKEAIDSYKKAVNLNDSVYEVWKELLYLLHKEGQYEELENAGLDAIDISALDSFSNGTL